MESNIKMDTLKIDNVDYVVGAENALNQEKALRAISPTVFVKFANEQIPSAGVFFPVKEEKTEFALGIVITWCRKGFLPEEYDFVRQVAKGKFPLIHKEAIDCGFTPTLGVIGDICEVPWIDAPDFTMYFVPVMYYNGDTSRFLAPKSA